MSSFDPFRELRTLSWAAGSFREEVLLSNSSPGTPVKQAAQKVYRKLSTASIPGLTLDQSQRIYRCILQAILYYSYCCPRKRSRATDAHICDGCKRIERGFCIPQAFKELLPFMGNKSPEYTAELLAHVFILINDDNSSLPGQFADQHGPVYYIYDDLLDLENLALTEINYGAYSWDEEKNNPIYSRNPPLFLYPIFATVARRLILEVKAGQSGQLR